MQPDVRTSPPCLSRRLERASVHNSFLGRFWEGNQKSAAMAMRALLRRSWRCRSAASDACWPVTREFQSDIASSAIASSSSVCSSDVSQFLKPPRCSTWTGPSSFSVSKLLQLHSLSSSSSALGAQRAASPVSSFLASAPPAAPLSVLSAGLHRSLADLRLGNVYGGAQQFQMQQRRGLSKLKKYKMKSYSSYKERFKLMADGTYKRWRSGTRHNAHSKTAKQRRQLRRPSIAPAALATVMKKLNFVR